MKNVLYVGVYPHPQSNVKKMIWAYILKEFNIELKVVRKLEMKAKGKNCLLLAYVSCNCWHWSLKDKPTTSIVIKNLLMLLTHVRESLNCTLDKRNYVAILQ